MVHNSTIDHGLWRCDRNGRRFLFTCVAYKPLRADVCIEWTTWRLSFIDSVYLVLVTKCEVMAGTCLVLARRLMRLHLFAVPEGVQFWTAQYLQSWTQSDAYEVIHFIIIWDIFIITDMLMTISSDFWIDTCKCVCNCRYNFGNFHMNIVMVALIGVAILYLHLLAKYVIRL